MVVKFNLRWRLAKPNPAGSHEEYSFELPWVGEPTCSSLPSKPRKGTSPGMDKIREKLHFQFCYPVDSNGREGGLALLRSYPLDITPKHFNNHFMIAAVRILNFQLRFTFTGVYGEPRTDKRMDFWNYLLVCILFLLYRGLFQGILTIFLILRKKKMELLLM